MISLLYMGAGSMVKLLPFIAVNLAWIIPLWLVLKWLERRSKKTDLVEKRLEKLEEGDY